MDRLRNNETGNYCTKQDKKKISVPLLKSGVHFCPPFAQLLGHVANRIIGVLLLHFESLLGGEYEVGGEGLLGRVGVLLLLLRLVVGHLGVVGLP